jgi:hypothetical protein
MHLLEHTHNSMICFRISNPFSNLITHIHIIIKFIIKVWLDIPIAVVQVHILLNDTMESIASVELIVVPIDENDTFGMLTVFESL